MSAVDARVRDEGVVVGQTEQRWEGRPGLARAIRTVALVGPALLALTVSGVVAVRLEPATTTSGAAVRWVLLGILSTVVLVVVDRFARRLLPLAALLRLTLVFPDRAPSRYKVARSVATTRQLQAEIKQAREVGIVGDRERAAETVLRLVAALSVHDRATRGHAERVRIFTDMIADEMDLDEAAIDRLRWASLLHDVGKIFVHPDILNKPDAPTAEEWEILRTHPLEGAKIVAPLQSWLGEWSLAIQQHHERWDGGGYPYGLAGRDISLAARIVAVADAFEVMTAARSYKRPMTAAAARADLATCAGSQFDPKVVRAFLSIGLSRVRWAVGPLTWLMNLPLVRLMPMPAVTPASAAMPTGLANVAAVATTAVATTGVGLSLPPAQHHAPPAVEAAAEDTSAMPRSVGEAAAARSVTPVPSGTRALGEAPPDDSNVLRSFRVREPAPEADDVEQDEDAAEQPHEASTDTATDDAPGESDHEQDRGRSDEAPGRTGDTPAVDAPGRPDQPGNGRGQGPADKHDRDTGRPEDPGNGRGNGQGNGKGDDGSRAEKDTGRPDEPGNGKGNAGGNGSSGGNGAGKKADEDAPLVAPEVEKDTGRPDDPGNGKAKGHG